MVTLSKLYGKSNEFVLSCVGLCGLGCNSKINLLLHNKAHIFVYIILQVFVTFERNMLFVCICDGGLTADLVVSGCAHQ